MARLSLSKNLQRVVSRYDELVDLMAVPGVASSDAFADMSREYAELTPIIESIAQLDSAKTEASSLAEMISDPEIDSEMRELANAEFQDLKNSIPLLEKKIQMLLLPKDEADEKNAILEVRAGTGGDEAALFAAELFRMYQRYSENRGWKFEILEMSETGIGGCKEAIASIVGRGVFARLKFESGVHRVQRIPTTESGGRIHTSAATVAVMPEAEEVDVHIDDKDLRIDVFRASGPGGQSVNTTDSAIRITHLSTGIVVSQQDEKSQHKNKAKAMRVLRSRLFEHQRQQVDAERAAARKSQVGSGDRSERIRTYNFPQGRITDHRINLTLYKLDRVLDGELDEAIDALISEDKSNLLADIK